MKILMILLAFLFGLNPGEWLNNFEVAQQTAKEKHQLILLNFSGSDWCIPCIKMKKEIFETDAFKKYAASKLVLVNADFPRKKNTISKEQVKLNEALAEKYNKDGRFPLSILITEDGRILKEWEGCPNVSPEAFTGMIESIKYDNKY
jgi:thioredoxin-related protein